MAEAHELNPISERSDPVSILDYEVFINGEKVGTGHYDRPEGHTNFRRGLYMGGKTLVKHDAMIFVTGASFK